MDKIIGTCSECGGGVVKCHFCEQDITDSKASYGSIYEPMCLKCHMEFQDEMNSPVYGLFVGGDPRKFQPDTQCSTPEEIALHAEVCAEWNAGNYSRTIPHSMIGANNM